MAEFVGGKREVIGLKEESAYGGFTAPSAAQDMLGRDATFDNNKDSKNFQEVRCELCENIYR